MDPSPAMKIFVMFNNFIGKRQIKKEGKIKNHQQSSKFNLYQTIRIDNRAIEKLSRQ